jgi:hypothetical protein
MERTRSVCDLLYEPEFPAQTQGTGHDHMSFLFSIGLELEFAMLFMVNFKTFCNLSTDKKSSIENSELIFKDLKDSYEKMMYVFLVLTRDGIFSRSTIFF